MIEEHNPDIQFDWTRILKGQDEVIPEAKPEQDRRAPRPQRAHEPGTRAQPEKVEAALPTPPIPPIVVVPEAMPQPHVELAPMLALAPDEPETATLRRLGPEGLLRLRARHAEVLARISEKIPEPERREELKAQAERLNPDTWVTDGEVAAGLEQYESVFESLRGVVGRRRKRRKRRSGRPTGTGEQAGTSRDGEPAQHEPSANDAEPEEE